MKIAYLIPEFPGQTHIFMWREISYLRQWGVDVNIFSTRHPDEATRAKHSFADIATAETYYLWPQSSVYLLSTLAWAIFNYPKGFVEMVKLCFTLKLDAKPVWRQTLPLLLVAPVLARKALESDIQYLNSQSAANSAVLCMLVKRLVGIPFSMVCNANPEWWGGAMLQKMSDAEFTVTVANWIFDQIRSDHPTLKPQQVIMAHHGVDTEKWQPKENSLERIAKQTGDSFNVVTVGRLHPCKGHDFLIKSIKILLDEGRKVNLKIIGSGPARDSLISLVEQLEITEFVTFTGSLSEDEIISIMSDSDAFVLASHAEPLGVVYMEAMAMGVPTIGTNAGGVPEIITHQEDGLLVPPKDEVALKQAIESLMDNPKLRESLAVNGRKKVVEEFDSRVGAKTLYTRLLGTSPVPVGQ